MSQARAASHKDAHCFRARRVHDARRTFISLSLADGARRDILRWVTHGPEGDIVGLYTTLPWRARCAEVEKLRIDVREGRVLKFPKVATVGCDSPCDSPSRETKKLPKLVGLEARRRVPRAGLEPSPRRISRDQRGPAAKKIRALPFRANHARDQHP